MHIKHSNINDIPRIMEIVAEAQQFLAQQQVDQWQNGYPNEAQIKLDIENEDSYIILDKNQTISATTVFTTKTETTYANIDGNWLTPTNNKYGVIHRLAISKTQRGKGIAQFILNTCEAKLIESKIPSMRIDTHKDNLAMQRLIKKLGYSYCGIIIVSDGTERLAFEKILL